jgi:hypothetical protein
VEDTFKIPTALVQDDRTSDNLPFGSRGGIAIPYRFPLDGEYRIKVLLRRQLYLYLIGMGESHQIDLRVDGALIKRFTVGGEGKGTTAPESFAGNTQGDPDWEVYMHTADASLTVRVPVTAGPHHVGVSFVRRHWEPEGVLQPPQRGFARTTNELYFENPRSTASPSQGRTPRARHTTRRAAGRYSCAARPRVTPRRSVRERFSQRWPAARTAGLSPRRTSRPSSPSTERDEPTRDSRQGFSERCIESSRLRAFCSVKREPETFLPHALSS